MKPTPATRSQAVALRHWTKLQALAARVGVPLDRLLNMTLKEVQTALARRLAS